MIDPNRNRNQQYNDLPALPGPKPIATKPLTAPSLPTQAGTAFLQGQQQITGAMRRAAGGVADLARPFIEPVIAQGPQVVGSALKGIEDFGRAAVGAEPRSTLVAPELPPSNPVAPPPTLPRRTGEEPAPQSRGGQEGGRLVPAAQAATPGPANGAPAGGVYAYGDSKQAFAFRHPLTGREHPYLTREQAEAGLAAESARMQTPEGKAEVVRALNNRPLNLTSDGKIPEGTFNPEEMALVAPELARTGLAGGKAESLGGNAAVTIAAPAAPPPNPPPSDRGEGSGVDVIRGTKVSRAGGGATGGGSAEGLRNDIASRVQYGIDAGSPLGAYGPELAFLKGIPQETAKGSGLPTLSQQQGQILAQHPELFEKIYGKAAPARRTKIVEQAVAPPLDANGNPGFPTGQKEFFNVDLDTGQSTPVDLSGGAGPEGGGADQAAAPHPLNQSPQAVAIRAAVRAGRMTPEQAKKQIAALAQ